MQQTPEAIVKRFYRDVLAFGKHDAAGEVLAPDYVDHGFAAYGEGRAGFLQRLAEIRPAFRDRLIVVEDVAVSGDQVLVRWSAGLTHSGDFLGRPPAGEQVDVSGTDVFRVEDGRIAERWNHESGLGLLDQLHLRAALSLSRFGSAERAAAYSREPAIAASH